MQLFVEIVSRFCAVSLSYAGFSLACCSPLCYYAAWSSHAISELQLSAAMPALALSRSSIAPELNRIQLSAICHGGQSGKVIDLLARRCLPLGHPSAASGACAVVQISSSKRQYSERQASLKAALRFKPTFRYFKQEGTTCLSWATGDLPI